MVLEAQQLGERASLVTSQMGPNVASASQDSLGVEYPIGKLLPVTLVSFARCWTDRVCWRYGTSHSRSERVMRRYVSAEKVGQYWFHGFSYVSLVPETHANAESRI